MCRDGSHAVLVSHAYHSYGVDNVPFCISIRGVVIHACTMSLCSRSTPLPKCTQMVSCNN